MGNMIFHTDKNMTISDKTSDSQKDIQFCKRHNMTLWLKHLNLT